MITNLRRVITIFWKKEHSFFSKISHCNLTLVTLTFVVSLLCGSLGTSYAQDIPSRDEHDLKNVNIEATIGTKNLSLSKGKGTGNNESGNKISNSNTLNTKNSNALNLKNKETLIARIEPQPEESLNLADPTLGTNVKPKEIITPSGITPKNLSNVPVSELKDHVIRVGSYPIKQYYDYNLDGSISGLGVDITNALARVMDLRYTFIKYKNKEDALKALAKNEIDILSPLTAEDVSSYIAKQNLSSRQKVINLQTFGEEYVILITLNRSSLVFEDYKSFDKIKVGILKNSHHHVNLAHVGVIHSFTPKLIEFENEDALFEALYAGVIDAVVTHAGNKTDNLKLLAVLGVNPRYYLFSPNAVAYKELVDTAIRTMRIGDPQFIYNLNYRYYPSLVFLPFTKKELDYIKQAKTINVAFKREYPPFSYIDEHGKLIGLEEDLFKRIAKITGLKFNFIELPLIFDNQKRLEFLQANEVKVVAGVENLVKNFSYQSSLFTTPYVVNYKYFFGKESTVIDYDLHMRVGTVGASSYNREMLQKRFPNFSFIPFASIEEVIHNIRLGKIDVALENRYSMMPLLEKPENADIKILPGITTESYVQNEMIPDTQGNFDIALTSILNKAINRVDKPTIMMDLNNHLENSKYVQTFEDILYKYRYIVRITAVTILLLIALGIYIIIIKRKVIKRVSLWEKRLWNITSNIDGATVVLKANETLTILYASDGFLKIIGSSRDVFKSRRYCEFISFIHPKYTQTINNMLTKGMAMHGIALELLKTNGEYVSVTLNCTFGKNIDGKKEIYGIIQDNSNYKMILERLSIEAQRNEIFYKESTDLYFEMDLHTENIKVSDSFENRLGWKLPPQLPLSEKAKMQVFVNSWTLLNEDALKFLEALYNVQNSGKLECITIKVKNETLNRFVWCELHIYGLKDANDNVSIIFGAIHNVDDIILEREKLIEKTKLDPLTKLYNQAAFVQLVKDALIALPNQNHALVFIDLDNFGKVNEILGHTTGDKVICDVADKLRVIFSNYDIISRFWGDEFCIFVKNIPHGTIYDKVEWLIEKIRQTYQTQDGSKEVEVTCSCGVCCTDLFGFDFETLLTYADISLYVAKANGRNTFMFYRDIPKQTLSEVTELFAKKNVARAQMPELAAAKILEQTEVEEKEENKGN